MNFARKVCITLAVSAISLGFLGAAAPAQAAKDTSWGCGGLCIVGPQVQPEE